MSIIELISTYPRITITVITPTLLVIGYLYRVRREKRENLKRALYILLEIWHRMSIFYRNDFDDAFDAMFKELANQFPNQKITTEEIEKAKLFYAPILKNVTRRNAFTDLETYESSYKKAISLISSDCPVFAYKISSASNTGKLLSSIQDYMDEALKPLDQGDERDVMLSGVMKSHISTFTELDSVKELEKDILSLSFRISIYMFFQSRKAIERRKKRLQNIGKNEMVNMVKNVLAPAINELNNKMQPMPDGASRS